MLMLLTQLPQLPMHMLLDADDDDDDGDCDDDGGGCGLDGGVADDGGSM